MAYSPRNPNGQATMANSGPVVIASDQSPVPVSGPATDAQMRATPIPVSGFPSNFAVNNFPSSFAVSNFPSSQLVTGTFWQATQPVSGTFWQATQPVSGTFWQATQPVSIAATVPVSGPLTDAQLRAAVVPVSGTVTANIGTIAGLATETTVSAMNGKMAALGQGTMAGSMPVVLASNQPAIPVTGTFWQATQPVSLTSTTITGTVAVTQSGSWTLAAGSAIVGKFTTDQTTHGTTDLVAADIVKLNGVAMLAGNGVTGTGSPRITIASDNTPFGIRVTDLTNFMPTMDVAARAGFHQITDGTTSASVKAASTLPAATDKALVVTQREAPSDATASGNITTQNLVPAGAATAGSAVEITMGAGQSTISIQVTGTYTGALSVQGTIDGTTWVTLVPQLVRATNNVITGTIASAQQDIWTAPYAGHAKIRVTGLAAMTGTATVTMRGCLGPASNLYSVASITTLASMSAGANLIADVGIQYRASATGGASTAKILTAATTNATSVKASAGRLIGWSLSNTTASFKYIHFHNLAVAPTVGTSVPMFTIAIPPNSYINAIYNGGRAMATGLAYSITGGIADLDATATAVGDVIGELSYA
jgi:hypothetical protein